MPVKRNQHMQDANSEYRRIKIKTNIGFIFFSVLFTAGLFLPYFSPDTLGPAGKTYRPELVKVIDIFLFPWLYKGAMALICVISILSIILRKAYSPTIVRAFILACFPEFAYHITFDINYFDIFLTGHFPFGSGYWVTIIAFAGLLICAVIDFANERFGCR